MRLRSDLLSITALIPIAYLILGCGDGPTEVQTDGPTEPDPATGSLEVFTVSIGSAIDPDGYTVVLNGAGSLAIDANGSLAVSNIAPGQFAVELTDLAADCQVIGENPETVTVEADEITSVSFEVSCPPFHDYIAFVSSRDGQSGIFVMQPDGANVIKIRDGGGYPAWSPDGTFIAFTAVYGTMADIGVLDLRTMEEKQLTHGAGPELSTWSPDGTKIAYSSFTGPAQSETWGDIYVMNADGSNPVNLTPGVARGSDPAWSPDGSQLAFVWNDEVWVMEADGANPVQLTDLSAAVTPPFYPVAYEPAWSPDGTRIAFGGPSRFIGPEIWVTSADGSNLTMLTHDPPGSQAWRPSWSPDGTRIVYWASRPDDGHCYEIYVMGSDGSNPTNLTDHESCDTDPAWSPGP